MLDMNPMQRDAERTLRRMVPRVVAAFEAAGGDQDDWRIFETRLRAEWLRLFGLLRTLYGDNYDFFYHMETLVLACAESWRSRPAWLKRLDARREAEPEWFQSEDMLGGVLYVDLFAGTLAALHRDIPYFKELGLTYLHLMPLFRAPVGNSDGGYAVSDYRSVDPRLGTIDDLRTLAEALHNEGISLTLDFVFNHTSDEHVWAERARADDPDYNDFYYLYPDRTVPDAYERTLREIFPTVRRGSFTWREDMQRWIWTTFNSFQWDLNYSNPAVFRAMAEEMLAIANAGVEILRLDAVAFIWKRLGTSCENLPEAHLIIQAYNAVARIAAPSMLFKSEAIVHPDDVLSYVSPHECQLSYNPLLMALIWESLATRETKLLSHSMYHRFALPAGTAWVNYLRSHDDIGWTFDDNDAWSQGIEPYGHRQFLNRFYTGRFGGSFARGMPFQENPSTGDARIAGTLASLAGLESALVSGNNEEIDQSVQRILMIHSIILSIGGIPLLYLGDELGTLNDYTFADDPAKADDSRWLHRPRRNDAGLAQRHNLQTVAGRIFTMLRFLIFLRKSLPALRNGALRVFWPANYQVFAYTRQHGDQRIVVLANFTERSQIVAGVDIQREAGTAGLTNLVDQTTLTVGDRFELAPYQFVWLQPRTDDDEPRTKTA